MADVEDYEVMDEFVKYGIVNVQIHPNLYKRENKAGVRLSQSIRDADGNIQTIYIWKNTLKEALDVAKRTHATISNEETSND